MAVEKDTDLVTVSKLLEQRDEKLVFYSLLKNPLRRQIITLLKENGAMAATDLKRILGISVGTLYYHLEFMQPFVVKTPKRKYMLSDRGLRLVESMKVSDYLAESSAGTIQGPRRFLLTLTLNPLLERIQLSKQTLIPVSALSTILYLIFSWRLSNSQILFHFRQIPSPELALIGAGGNIVLMFVLLTFAGLVTSMRFGGEGVIALTLPIVLTPSNILLTYFTVVSGFGLLSSGFLNTFSGWLYLALHVWQVAAVAGVLVSAKGVSWERAILASVVLSYISLFISQNF